MMAWLSDFLTLTFGLAALVFAVTVLMPGAKFSVWLRGRRWAVVEVVSAAVLVSWFVLFSRSV